MSNGPTPNFGLQIDTLGHLGLEQAYADSMRKIDAAALRTDRLPSLLVGQGVYNAGNKVITIGDSRSAFAYANTTTLKGYTSQGVVGWLRSLTRHRFQHDRVNDAFAVSGYTSADIIANLLPAAAATKASLAIVWDSTNDRTNGITYDQSVANNITIRDRLLAAGIRVLFIAETPRGDATLGGRLTGTPLQDHLRMHRWFQTQAAVTGVYVADVWADWVANSTSTTLVDVVPAFVVDGLHQNFLGAYNIAKKVQPIIETLFPPGVDFLPSSNADIYDATLNPTGLVSPNPVLGGTGGTIVAPSAGTMSGTLADNHVAELVNGAGLTVVLSKQVINGVTWQQAVVTGTPTSSFPNLKLRHSGITVNAGDKLAASVARQIDAGQTGLNGFTLSSTDGLINYQDGGGASTYAFPTAAIDDVLRTETFTMLGTTIATNISAIFLQNVAVNVTLRFRALNTRKFV